MITQERHQCVCLHQFLGHKVDFAIYNARYQGPIQNGGWNVTITIKWFWLMSIAIDTDPMSISYSVHYIIVYQLS